MLPPVSQIRWFRTRKAFLRYSASILLESQAAERRLTERATFNGYCHRCRQFVDLTVSGGAHFAVLNGGRLSHVANLREGLVCPICRLKSRQRLVYNAVTCESFSTGAPRTLLLEHLSELHTALRGSIRDIVGTEYLGPDKKPGQSYVVDGIEVRHESLPNLSFPDEEFDLVIHNDILEHIPEYRDALRESRRVLKVGGVLLFTCPFFERRSDVLVRARMLADGQVEHLEPAEWHGDRFSRKGILAFYHFGWGLVHQLRRTGFADVRIGVQYDPLAGLITNNYPHDPYGRMLPVLFRCVK